MSMQCMQQLMCASPALRESALLLGACMDEGDDLFATLEALAELEPGQAGGDSVMQAFEGPVLKGPAMSASLAPADQTEVTADRYRLNGQSRLRWSAHLHALFQACVEQLGGPAAATPAAIQRLMEVPGLSIVHIKSHLQRYRRLSSEPGHAARSPPKLKLKVVSASHPAPPQPAAPPAAQLADSPARMLATAGRLGSLPMDRQLSMGSAYAPHGALDLWPSMAVSVPLPGVASSTLACGDTDAAMATGTRRMPQPMLAASWEGVAMQRTSTTLTRSAFAPAAAFCAAVEPLPHTPPQSAAAAAFPFAASHPASPAIGSFLSLESEGKDTELAGRSPSPEDGVTSSKLQQALTMQFQLQNQLLAQLKLQQQLQMTLEAHGHTIQQIMQGHAFTETSRRSA